MDENWYAVEQEIRDRITEARAAARIRALIQKRAPTARRSVGITIIRLGNWDLNLRGAVASGAFTRARQRASSHETA